MLEQILSCTDMCSSAFHALFHGLYGYQMKLFANDYKSGYHMQAQVPIVLQDTHLNQ